MHTSIWFMTSTSTLEVHFTSIIHWKIEKQTLICPLFSDSLLQDVIQSKRLAANSECTSNSNSLSYLNVPSHIRPPIWQLLARSMDLNYKIWAPNVHPVLHNIELKLKMCVFGGKKLSSYPYISLVRSSKQGIYQLNLNSIKCCVNYWCVRMSNYHVLLYSKYLALFSTMSKSVL